MFETEKTMWKKKGFYVSVCTALVCLLAIGTVYYRMNKTPERPQWSSVLESQSPSPDKDQQVNQSSDESIKEKAALTSQTPIVKSKNQTAKKSSAPAKKLNGVTEKKSADQKASVSKKNSQKASSDEAAAANATVRNQKTKHFAFQEEQGLAWPVKGKVLMKFSINNTVYFKTLEQYRCNPALIIGAKEGTKVKAAADGEVLSVSKEDETGVTVAMNIGNEYTLTYGQLKGVSLKEGDEVKKGDVIGKIATPTTFYTEEGSNLYFKVQQADQAVDPLLLLD